MGSKLFTIGYEAAAIEDFVETLRAANVTVLVDIRDVPVSRRKGFSKNQLAARIEADGIEYLHFKALGDPAPGRNAARAGDHAEFLRIYRAVLKTPEAVEALGEIEALIEDEAVCLLCYERDPEHCHRTLVARELQLAVDFRVVNLGVRHGISDRQEIGAMRRSRQGDAPRR